MHQLGLLPAALHYYKKALTLEPIVAPEEDKLGIYNLEREIAFNLSLIYQSSGAHELARMYLQKHIVI